MAMTSGFNPVQVNSSISAVMTAHAGLMSCLATKMQTNFVNEMGREWACNKAIDFFAGFKTAEDGLIQKADSTFQSVVDTMNQAAQNWAAGTDTTYVKKPFRNFSKRITVEGVIKENINNERGIDEPAAKATVNKLAPLALQADINLQKAVSAVQNCGFLDSTEATNLVASLGEIKEKIKESFDEINGKVKDGIDATLTEYGSIESTNAETFIAK